jgi:hypothetical protein
LAVVATPAENRISGSASDRDNPICSEPGLSNEVIRGNLSLVFDLASDGAIAAREGGRGANRLKPDPKATGPHSTWKTDADGNIAGHTEWTPNAQNPSGFDEVKRVDLQGGPHYNKATGQDVPAPHAHEKGIPGNVRPARPDEIPKDGN